MIDRRAGLLLIGLWMTTAAAADSPAARLVTVEREVGVRAALPQGATEPGYCDLPLRWRKSAEHDR